MTTRPTLTTSTAGSALPGLYDAALRNLLDVNIVPARESSPSDPLAVHPRRRRVSGAWTRDAAINAWGGGSVLVA